MNYQLDWFDRPGVNFVVDGAFGSTGKGAASAWIWRFAATKPSLYTTNASPNAGHTAYWKGRKIVTRHLSVAGVIDHLQGGTGMTYLNPGAIIDPGLLEAEVEEFGMHGKILVANNATVILHRHKQNHESLAKIASTQKGTGPAMADRLLRHSDMLYGDRKWSGDPLRNFDYPVLCEVPQGYSLGLHSGFYPYTTNRECTVMQGASDLGCPHSAIRNVMMTIRTFPIRVGNTADGYSGPVYDDQHEISWEELGVEPEITTVTKRVRRVFTFSWEQFRRAVYANHPNALWLGFMDYLGEPGSPKATAFFSRVVEEYQGIMGKTPDLVAMSHGPLVEDVIWTTWQANAPLLAPA